MKDYITRVEYENDLERLEIKITKALEKLKEYVDAKVKVEVLKEK